MKRLLLAVICVFMLSITVCSAKSYDLSVFPEDFIDEMQSSFVTSEVLDYINDDKKEYPYWAMYGSDSGEYTDSGFVPEYVYYVIFSDYTVVDKADGAVEVKLIDGNKSNSSQYMCPIWRGSIEFTQNPYHVKCTDKSQIATASVFYCAYDNDDVNKYNSVIYATNCNFADKNGVDLNSFFMLPHSLSVTPTPVPTPTPIPIPSLEPVGTLEDLTVAEIMKMGQIQIFQIVKIVILLVLGSICLIFLSPLLKKSLRSLRQLVMRS